jgi:hypothetical protein
MAEGMMMTAPNQDNQQKIIDHEVLLAQARVVREQSRIARQERIDGKVALGELLWLREQYISMLRAAETEQEVRELGLTDEAIREANLGTSVGDAWQRAHTPPPRSCKALKGPFA